MKIIELTGTTDFAGDLTITDTDRVIGYVEKIVIDSEGDNGAQVVITNEDIASEAIITKAGLATSETSVVYPRTPANKVADASAFTNWASKILTTGAFKAVVSSGGATADYRFIVYLSDGGI